MPRSRGRKGDSKGKHRLRREIGVGRRRVKELATQWQKTFTVLLTVLAQSGGEVTITKGTMEQVAAQILRTTYEIQPGKEPNEFVVRLVEGPQVNTPVPEPVVQSEVPDAVG